MPWQKGDLSIGKSTCPCDFFYEVEKITDPKQVPKKWNQHQNYIFSTSLVTGGVIGEKCSVNYNGVILDLSIDEVTYPRNEYRQIKASVYNPTLSKVNDSEKSKDDNK